MTSSSRQGSATRPPRMTLGSVSKVPPIEPDRVFIYGVEKVGKSTFGACAPEPIFISAERGLGELDPVPAHFPEAETFQDVLDAIEALTTGQHEYRTLVLDSLDWIEQMIVIAVCQRTRTKSGKQWDMNDFTAYGAGQKIAVEDWRSLILALDRLQTTKGMEVILVAHAKTKDFDDPTGARFSRYEPQMSGDIAPKLIKQWAKSILFARFEYRVQEAEGFGKSKGISTGRRVVYTQWSAAYDAGSRYILPPVMELDYAAYAAARDASRGDTTGDMVAEAQRLLASWETDQETRGKAQAAIEAAKGNGAKLSRLIEHLKTKLNEKGGA